MPTLIASDATTKNHPPDIDIIAFQTRPGVENGSSRRSSRRKGDRPKPLATSFRSAGTCRSDWYRLKAMFQAWLVKIAKIAAHSTPIRLPGNSPMNAVTVKVMKPSTGTDWRMSSAGMMTSSARLLLAAAVAANTVKTNEATSAANSRSVVSSA